MKSFKILLPLSVWLVLAACRGEDRVRDSASTAPPEVAAKTAKLTPPPSSQADTPAPPPLRLGMKMKFKKLTGEPAQKLAKEFETQINVFQPCMEWATGKTEIVRVTADFQLSTKGLIEGVKIRETSPPAPDFEACFLRQIQQLDLGPQTREVNGELTVGTFVGSDVGPSSGWNDPKAVQ